MTPEDPISERAGEVALLRRELDRQFQIRLQHVEDRLESLEEQIRVLERMISTLEKEVQRMLMHQQEQAPGLVAMNRLMQSGLVLRWMVAGMVGVLAALATVATAWEAIQKWFR